MDNNFEELKSKVYNSTIFKNLEITDTVLDRINYELEIIQKLNFTDYFLLFSRICEVCNELKIIRSLGRGNAAGSFVNYCLDITKINPLNENLFFERFIHPEQKNLPDIDLDISKGSQKLVLNKLKEKYPEYKIHSIAVPYKSNELKIGYLIHDGIKYKKISVGVVITSEVLSNYIIKYKDEDFIILNPDEDELYFNKTDLVELEYLKRIQLIVDEIGEEFHPYNLSTDDPSVYEVFCSADTENIFQFHVSGLINILKAFKPNSIRDLSIINALYRPGVADDIPTLITNKQMNINYEWSDLHVTEILSETYGLLIFQETFYRLFNEIAGISITDTDKWRVKMFKGKQKVELDIFNDVFITGCRNNSSLNEKEISMLLNLINRSFLFTFLKAHSFSYSTVAYWGAYYKKYHRKVFDEVFEDYMRII